MSRKVIIDTDPGIDDLLALSIALVSEEIDILAISTVFGNVSLENTTANMELISDIFKSDVQIIKGSDAPLVYPKKDSSVVHGNDGLGNLRIKYRRLVETSSEAKNGLFNLYNLIKESPEKITIIALGPLTNIAKLLMFDETLKDNIEEIHVMGGGVGMGNVNELVEFNFFSDSYAADYVLNCGLPIYLSALNATKQVYFTEEEFNTLKEDSLKQKLIKDSLKFYYKFDPFLHDVCSILTVTHPQFFESEKVEVKVVSNSDETDGMSYLVAKGEHANVHFMSTDKREEIVNHIFTIIDERLN